MKINLVVEGRSDIEAASAIVRAAGHSVGDAIPKIGVNRLDKDLRKYAEAARWSEPHEAWIVFRDTDGKCPVELRNRLLNGVVVPARFQLRLARTMTEAWLLGDRPGIASFLRVPEKLVPRTPERLSHAKRTLLQIASKSSNRQIRNGMVAGKLEPGPRYVEIVNEFARDHWDTELAAQSCGSLQRAINRITDMHGIT